MVEDRTLEKNDQQEIFCVTDVKEKDTMHHSVGRSRYEEESEKEQSSVMDSAFIGNIRNLHGRFDYC